MRVSLRERTTSGAVRERTRKTAAHRELVDECTRFDEALAFDVSASDAARLALRVELHSLRRPHAMLGAFQLASRVRPPAPLPPLVPPSGAAGEERTDAATATPNASGDELKQQQQWFASSAEARAQWLDVLAQRQRSDTPRWHSVFAEPQADRSDGISIWQRARNSLLRRKRAPRAGSSCDAGECSAETGGSERSECDEELAGWRRSSRSVRERRRRTVDPKQSLFNKQLSFQ